MICKRLHKKEWLEGDPIPKSYFENLPRLEGDPIPEFYFDNLPRLEGDPIPNSPFKGLLIKKGGPGSGNFGHEGRPGEVGGSAPSEGGGKE